MRSVRRWDEESRERIVTTAKRTWTRTGRLRRLRLRRECAATRSATKTSSSRPPSPRSPRTRTRRRGDRQEGRRRHRHGSIGTTRRAKRSFEAAYRSEVAKLCNGRSATVGETSSRRGARPLPRSLHRLHPTKKGMLEALKAVAAAGGNAVHAEPRDAHRRFQVAARRRQVRRASS